MFPCSPVGEVDLLIVRGLPLRVHETVGGAPHVRRLLWLLLVVGGALQVVLGEGLDDAGQIPATLAVARGHSRRGGTAVTSQECYVTDRHFKFEIIHFLHSR